MHLRTRRLSMLRAVESSSERPVSEEHQALPAICRHPRKRTLTDFRPYTDGRMFPRDRNLGTTLIEILRIGRSAFSSIACCLQLPRNIWTSIVE